LQGREGNLAGNAPIECLYPEVKRAATETPEPARRCFQQAFETLHARDAAAAAMAGSAVDAVLKHLKLADGSVYLRKSVCIAEIYRRIDRPPSEPPPDPTPGLRAIPVRCKLLEINSKVAEGMGFEPTIRG
jgi:hypothetical protein